MEKRGRDVKMWQKKIKYKWFLKTFWIAKTVFPELIHTPRGMHFKDINSGRDKVVIEPTSVHREALTSCWSRDWSLWLVGVIRWRTSTEWWGPSKRTLNSPCYKRCPINDIINKISKQSRSPTLDIQGTGQYLWQMRGSRCWKLPWPRWYYRLR